MRYTSRVDILVTQVNISKKVLAFWPQFLLQNTSFMSLITKFILVIVKQKIDIVVKNSYFKLLAYNITPFILEEFFLKKIKNNIKANISFFYSLIREVSGIKKVNAANSD